MSIETKIEALKLKMANLIKEKDNHVKNQKYDLAVQARDEYNVVAKELDKLKKQSNK